MTLAGKLADIVSVVPSLRAGAIGAEVAAEAVPSKYDERMAWIKQGAEGRVDPPELQIWTTFAAVTDSRPDVVEQWSGLFGISPEDVSETPVGLVGSIAEITEQLEQRRERWGFSYIVIHEGEIDSFAPVVAALTGH